MTRIKLITGLAIKQKLQEDYKDLVNGSPSSVLIALDSIANGKNDEP